MSGIKGQLSGIYGNGMVGNLVRSFQTDFEFHHIQYMETIVINVFFKT